MSKRGIGALIIAALSILAFILLINSSEAIAKYVNANEPFVRIALMLVSTVITATAMFVALFKEDIRGIFVRPKLQISKVNKLEETTRKVSKGALEAIEYFYKIRVSNMGSVPANKVEAYLESLSIKKEGSHLPNEIETDGIPLKWASSINQIMIPINTTKSLVLFKLFPSESESTPDQQSAGTTKTGARILIGENVYPVDQTRSEWYLVFGIYSENTKPTKIILKIQWNGSWHARLTEMSAACLVQEVNNA